MEEGLRRVVGFLFTYLVARVLFETACYKHGAEGDIYYLFHILRT